MNINGKIALLTCLLILLLHQWGGLYAQEPAQPDSTVQVDSLKHTEAGVIPDVAPAQSKVKPHKKDIPWIYVHGVGGLGLSFLSAGEITDLLGGEFGIGLDLPSASYGVRGGIKNALQVEYNIGKGKHDFNNNSILMDIPSQVIEMSYKSEEFLFKINPFFLRSNLMGNLKGADGIFLVFGGGDVTWLDKDGDGFRGKSSILGFEYNIMLSFLSLTYGMRRYDIEFDRAILLGMPFDVLTSGSEYVFEIKMGLGFGL